MVVGDSRGEAVAGLGDAQAGLVGGEAEVGDAALKGGARAGLAGGEVGGDFVLGEEARDGEGVALVLEVFDLGLDDAVELLFDVRQELFEDWGECV